MTQLTYATEEEEERLAHLEELSKANEARLEKLIKQMVKEEYTIIEKAYSQVVFSPKGSTRKFLVLIVGKELSVRRCHKTDDEVHWNLGYNTKTGKTFKVIKNFVEKCKQEFKGW